MENNAYHVPVLLKECIEGLSINPAGIYVDATFGGGGHSKEILKHLTTGKLIGFDQDEDAHLNALTDERFILVKQNFRMLENALYHLGITAIDGLLADLGVSSHQFDTPERGFSTRFDAALDMRMGKSGKVTAATVLNTYSEHELRVLFRKYGEIENAAKLARTIFTERKEQAINSVSELKKVIGGCVKWGKENQYYAQVFQALRIEVNDELHALEELLMQTGKVIKPGGRLVVIAYHSLEDRLVKNFIRSGRFEGDAEKDMYGNVSTPFKAINRKPIEAEEQEVKMNSRARSAKLRIAEKI